MEEGDNLERGGRIILKCLLQKWLRIEMMALVNTVMNRRVP